MTDTSPRAAGEPGRPGLGGSSDPVAAPRRLADRIRELRPRTVVAICVGVAAFVRIAYLVLIARDIPLDSDAFQYHAIATNIADGKGYVDTYPQIVEHVSAFRPPVYPYLLGGLYAIVGPSVTAGRVLSLVIGVATVALLTTLVVRQFGAISGLAAGLAVALFPNLIANDTTLLTESVSLLIITGILFAIVEDRWAVAGVLTGLLVLTRPSAQYLLVVLAIWLLTRVGWKRAAGFGAIALLVIAPWIARNWVELGSPVLVTSNGFNFAAIYSPPALERDGFVDANADPYWADRRLDQFDEVVWDKKLRKDGVDSIKDNPRVVLHVIKRNVGVYFEIHPQMNENAELMDGRNLDFRRATLPYFYVVLVAGTVGLVRARRRALAVGAALIGIYFSAASLAFVAPPRLRSPLDLMLCIGVGALFLRRSELRDKAARDQPLQHESDPESGGADAKTDEDLPTALA